MISAWNLDPRLICLLAVIAAVYLRGWIRVRRLVRDPRDGQRLCCFWAALLLLFIAAASPLDTYDAVLLSAHMGQHLILMMLAPALLLLGYPVIPLLRGLPKWVVKKVIGPLLVATPLRQVLSRISSPPVAWAIFAVDTIFWHIPACYELALERPPLHALEHACFFWSGVLFWWPIIRPVGGRSKWPEWVGIPYLMLADLLNTGLSAFFVFSNTLLYPTYAAFHPAGVNPRNDQTLAGVLMWVPGSVVYLVPVVILAMRLLSPPRVPPAARRVRRQTSAFSNS